MASTVYETENCVAAFTYPELMGLFSETRPLNRSPERGGCLTQISARVSSLSKGQLFGKVVAYGMNGLALLLQGGLIIYIYPLLRSRMISLGLSRSWCIRAFLIVPSILLTSIMSVVVSVQQIFLPKGSTASPYEEYTPLEMITSGDDPLMNTLEIVFCQVSVQ